MKTDNLLKRAIENESECSVSSADKTFANETKAVQAFSALKRKLSRISEWNIHSLMSTYALFDESGREKDTIGDGDFIRISLKASGKYDWIRVTEIYDAPDEFVITVKPSFDPTAENVDKSLISHFFTDEAVNNFCVSRTGASVSFYVIGLDEKPNTTETEGALDAIRNAAVNLATYLGMQKTEWEKFCHHFIEDTAAEIVGTKGEGYLYDAVVVGSGPNGLSAAVCLAQNGLSVLVVEAADEIGGGVRSAELTLPGFTHDICSAIHPLTIASPYFKTLPLADFGLEFVQPSASLAHPFDDGSAVLLKRSIDETANQLGADEESYKKLVEILTKHWDVLVPDVLAPLGIPKNPFLMAGFGLKALSSAKGLADIYFSEPRARAMFAGNAAHSMIPLEDTPSAAFGLILLLTAHAVGWGFPKGGANKIGDALSAYFLSLGGRVETGNRVENVDDLPPSRVVLFDLTPRQIVKIAGHRLPAAYRKRLEAYRYGAGAFKMDFALSEPVPWKAKECFEAGTLHLGGTFEEIARSEREHEQGKISEKPFVLLAQQTLFDLTRAPAGKHTLWAYCHVPNGSAVDMTTRIEDQIERFAPGFRDCILAKATATPVELELHNANYVGGDINGGAGILSQIFTRPVAKFDPYKMPARGLYICSASTPPGGGVHGMCGFHAAKSALNSEFGMRD